MAPRWSSCKAVYPGLVAGAEQVLRPPAELGAPLLDAAATVSYLDVQTGADALFRTAIEFDAAARRH